MINALDLLLPNQRDAVLSYTPIAGGIGEQLKKASDKAAQRGDSLYLPAGLWLIKANNGADLLSGWRINIPENKSLLIFGDGDATIIRREATQTLVKTSPLIWIVENDKINISFQNLLVDGNEANCPADSSNPFAYEQSANVKFLSGSGTPNNVTFDNVTMTGCVGDGFHANVKIQSLQVSNWRSYGRTRRPRADIQLSYIPLQVTNITNFIGDAFEMEPFETNTEHIINLSNMLVRGALDLAGDEDGVVKNFANVKATNITHLGQLGVGLPVSNFFRVRGEFVNCQFVNTARIQNCQIKFNGGKFTVLGKGDMPTKTDGIAILHNQPDRFVEFNGVSFDVRGEVTSGVYFLKSEATSDVGRETRFINCRTVHKLDYFANADRNGTMLFDGGQIGGKTAAVQINHGGSGEVRPEYITRAIIKNPEHWTSTLIEIKFVSNNNSDKIRIEMHGQFNAEIQQPIFNSTSKSNSNITWIGGFTGAVVSTPNGRIRGLPGLILRKSEPISSEIVEWQYKQGKTYASMQYVP